MRVHGVLLKAWRLRGAAQAWGRLRVSQTYRSFKTPPMQAVSRLTWGQSAVKLISCLLISCLVQDPVFCLTRGTVAQIGLRIHYFIHCCC